MGSLSFIQQPTDCWKNTAMNPVIKVQLTPAFVGHPVYVGGSGYIPGYANTVTQMALTDGSGIATFFPFTILDVYSSTHLIAKATPTFNEEFGYHTFPDAISASFEVGVPKLEFMTSPIDTVVEDLFVPAPIVKLSRFNGTTGTAMEGKTVVLSAIAKRPSGSILSQSEAFLYDTVSLETDSEGIIVYDNVRMFLVPTTWPTDDGILSLHTVTTSMFATYNQETDAGATDVLGESLFFQAYRYIHYIQQPTACWQNQLQTPPVTIQTVPPMPDVEITLTTNAYTGTGRMVQGTNPVVTDINGLATFDNIFYEHSSQTLDNNYVQHWPILASALGFTETAIGYEQPVASDILRVDRIIITLPPTAEIPNDSIVNYPIVNLRFLVCIYPWNSREVRQDSPLAGVPVEIVEWYAYNSEYEEMWGVVLSGTLTTTSGVDGIASFDNVICNIPVDYLRIRVKATNNIYDYHPDSVPSNIEATSGEFAVTGFPTLPNAPTNLILTVL